MKREVKFEAGYDKVEEGKGRHGLQIRFLLTGEHGVVQFLMYTDWLPSEVKHRDILGPHVDRRVKPSELSQLFPMAADLGYHWHKPKYEDQRVMSENCEILNGPCYYDGSGLNAERVMAILFTKGSDGVWEYLEKYYNDLVIEEHSD